MTDNNDNKTPETPKTPVDTSQFLTREQANKEWQQRENSMLDKFKLLLEDRDAREAAKNAPPQEKLSRTAELEKQVSDLSKNIQIRDAKEKDQDLRKATVEALREVGINRDFEDHAVSFLVDAKKMIKYAPDGSMKMTVNGAVYDNISEGMAAWNQTKDAKLYRPATGAAGTGDQSKQSQYGKENSGPDQLPGVPTIKRDENGKMTKESRLQMERYFGN